MARLDLEWEALLSFVLLAASYLCLYAAIHRRTTFARYSMTVLLVASGAPLAAMLIVESRRTATDANIGLGMAFMLTWLITAVVFAASFIVWLLKKRKRA
ncbi:hypothetical protein [Paenibacillus sp. MMS20-IR301]|uniref:hypothetical protein n=1 Tax=Paenibacillus sp. MMS20-IR301 TaxID=2895946 RepID=UPI0028F0A607|nr:hypothetical protein [Paenibacillus sp. MMS20-IR301]WNS41199.1 hypothetical protein LOS79_19375 [Paenibacillus sp. MMS20-IR301]